MTTLKKSFLIFAEDDSQLAETVSFAALAGADNVDCVTFSAETKIILPEQWAQGLSNLGRDGHYGIIVLPGSKLGREIAPRLAVILHSGYVEGVIGLEIEESGDLLFQRLTLGGTCVEKIEVKTATAIVTLQQGRKFTDRKSKVIPKEIQVSSGVQEINFAKELLEVRPLQSSENIQSNERIVAIGRGIRKKEDIVKIEEFAHAINAGIGVTRPLVEDLKWFSKERQIGLSGNAVKPELYIGIGVSGQVQHIVGMRDSKIIVAINKDRTAPILVFADYSVIGDLYAIVPEMTRQLKEGASFPES